MPLRDHFRPPISSRYSWEGVHGGWPMTMVQHLAHVLPNDFSAEPRVHLGSYFDLDLSTYEDDEPKRSGPGPQQDGNGIATATWSPPQPTLTIETDLGEQYEYEVQIYDQGRGRRLVAAVEIVSPANKDRPENRKALVTKCTALLQQGVCVSLVDLVTLRHFNLYTDLLAEFGGRDPAFAGDASSIYAATCRGRRTGKRPRVDAWAYPLQVGQRLPKLPIWLAADLAVELDLESSYEDTCAALRIS
ncbi:MAG: DUF4058 family protein [Gemmataceae bacterium]